MVGSDPKYLDLQKEETIKYNIRIENSLINKYKELSNLTGKSTARLIKEVLRAYFKDRTVYNTYLENIELFYMEIPYNIILKDYLTSNLDDPYFFRTNGKQENFNGFINCILEDEIDGLTNYGNEALNNLYELPLYKVYRMPNNLDKWNEKTSTYSSYYKYGTDYINTGLELLIIPELAKYTNNYLNCLYCFYFELNKENANNNLMVTLISITEALDLIGKANNIYFENLANTIYNKLENAQTKEEIEEIANTYNTNNIIRSDRLPRDNVQPLKLMINKDKVAIDYHDKELLNKVEALEKENQDLKKELDYINEALDDKLQRLDEINKIFEKYEIDKILNNKGL